MADKGATVLVLDPNRPPVSIRPRGLGACAHRSLEIDTDLRSVFCAYCNAQLDPVQVLIQMAEGYREQRWKEQELEAREQRLDAMARRRRRPKETHDQHQHDPIGPRGRSEDDQPRGPPLRSA